MGTPSPGRRVDRALVALAWITPLSVFLAIYGAAAGRGFISDDFGWIYDSRVSSVRDAIALFGRNHGFYRPLVSLSFAANYALFRLDAAGYGYTNLTLAVLCAALLFQLCRDLGLRAGAAGFAVAIWVLNFHGISMAVLWISGRTALLLVASSLAAAIGVARRSLVPALGCFALALLSKEEAVLLPLVLLSIAAIGPALHKRPIAGDRRFLLFLGAGLVMELAVYFVLRAHSGAITPATAPDYYRFTFEPRAVFRNVGEYADRACTLGAGAALLGWILLRPGRIAAASVRSPIVVLGCIWLVAGYAITVFLPVRSDLYACLPSVGAALLTAEWLAACWATADSARRRAALAAVVAIPLACAPIYIARNHRWTDLAGFSTRVLDQIVPRLETADERTRVVLLDDQTARRVNVRSAFGTLIVDALRLRTDKDLSVWVEPAWTNGQLPGLTPPCASCPRRVFAIRDGAVVAN